ncbi:MAG: PAS domain-containing protein [Zoogloea sp.]|nr:PAS domain-containing protein [Zoogloea sp.]
MNMVQGGADHGVGADGQGPVAPRNRTLAWAACGVVVWNVVFDAGVVILDRRGVVQWVGPSIRKALGYREREVRGRSIFGRIDRDDAPRLSELMAAVAASEGGEAAFRCRIQHRDGSWRIHEGNCVNLLEDDCVGGLLVTFRDVTARIEAEDRIRQRDLELSHMARLSTTGEMASALAHELNQPFFAIMNFVGGAILRAQSGRLADAELHDVLQNMRNQAERAGRIIRTVRNFTRKSSYHRETVDIRTIVEEIAPFIEIEARARRIRVNYRLLREPAEVNCDWVLIEQVISNIARNGIEAMVDTPQERRQLTIAIHLTAAGTVNLSIEDEGHGLPRSNPDRIFDAFFTTKKEGLGIGLSLCRSIIDSHGGHLWATRGAAGGAKFHFSLPLASGDPRDARPSP